MGAKRSADLNHGRESASCGPAAPRLQVGRGVLTPSLPQVLEREAHVVGPDGLQVQRVQGVGQGDLPVGQVVGLLDPDVAAAGEFGVLLLLVAAHGVDGFTDQLHDVELVEGDLRLREGVADSFAERRGHVDTEFLDLLRLRVVQAEVVAEGGERGRAPAFGGEEQRRLLQLHERRDVVLATLAGRFAE